MMEESTTGIVQRYLNALAGDAPAEPIIRDLLDCATRRLERLCSNLLHRSYPRLTRPPSNLDTDEMLGGVVEGLLKALRSNRPKTVRHFFALASQHMLWQLNDLARRLDERPVVSALREEDLLAPDDTDSGISSNGRRILEAIDNLPDEEREVFSLVRLQGLTHREAAVVLGVAVKTVQRRLNRASLLLSENLASLRPAQQ